MTQPQQPNDSKQQFQCDREYQDLVAEYPALIAAITQKTYALKLLKSVRQGLLMHLSYKATRQLGRPSQP